MQTIRKPDLLKRAVAAQRKISDRAENLKLEDHRHLFVNNTQHNFAGALAGRANQIVFGRRGTGKTMLLNKLLHDGQPFNPDSDYIAIMVQVPDFLRSPDVTEKDPAVIRARSYFKEFLYQVAVELIRIHDNILKNEDFLARIGLKNKTKRAILGDRFLQLSHILQYGVPMYDVSLATFGEHAEYFQQIQDESGTVMKLGVGANAGAKSGGPTTDISVSPVFSLQSRSGQTRLRKILRKEDITGDYDLGIPEIREKLRDILEMIQADQVMILLDEWQALSLDCQSEFAHLLNRCFFGIDCVSVKIAAYRHVCHFNNGGTRGNFRGLELGQDIEVVGDTDLPPAEDNTKKFFLDILYKRLIYMEPNLEKHYGTSEDFDYVTLVNDIFQNQHASDMLVRGCHGVSRDFIKVFNLAASDLDNDIMRQNITLDAVDKAHAELSRAVQNNVHVADDIGGLLFELIKPHTHKTGKPYFFLPDTEHQWDSQLWELVEKRAIHAIPETGMPYGAKYGWRGFEVSYGLFQRWSSANTFAGGRTGPQMKWADATQLPSEEFESHLLTVQSDPASMRICNACKEQYSTTCHSFMIARLCPSCYSKQDD